MKRILKPTGSIYLHCDSTMSHSLKMTMDAIFCSGRGLFINEIVWQRASKRAKGSQFEAKSFGVDVDYILFYSKTGNYKLSSVGKLDEVERIKKFPLADERGRYNVSVPLFRAPSMGDRPNLCYEYKGVENPHPSGWRVSKEKLIKMDGEGLIIWRKGRTRKEKPMKIVIKVSR